MTCGVASAYERALHELYALSSRGIEPGLSRMSAALELAGHPERSFQVVHVAGTNGKGSVSNAVFTGLRGRAGLFTSPHLHRLTERFRVRLEDDEPDEPDEISREELVETWDGLRRVLRSPGAPPLTFFETVTLMAFRLFERRGAEIVVLETGLGGRLDATNVIEAPLVCAITRVGLDHRAFLGDELPRIAREKAGILKPGVPCVVGPQPPVVLRVLAQRAEALGAPLVRVPEVLLEGGTDLEGGSPERLAGYVRENVSVAVEVLRVLARRGLEVDVSRAIAARWPGRLERLCPPGSPPYLLDAAHNLDGAEALARYLARRPTERRVLLFGAMADKDWPEMLATLRPHVEHVVFGAAPLTRAERPETLAARVPGDVAPTTDAAMKRAGALAHARGATVVVAGSIFLMAEVRARLLGVQADPPIAL